ncbi:MAG TPA: D-cysteine desulfhydrase family protein [Anaerolineaceae bacterium]|nr:MAG: 1-aminocyclopropane-1-carboxylate deaminase [Anaerolineae bacterium 49_20]HAE85524.1 D-cysteine desulfhydrase family protein [Anaerolineaceae bacterium]
MTNRTNRIALAHLPTPIEPLPALTKLLDGPQLFIKRDDLTGLGFGGNKTRKLEYLVADALAQGCQTLVTTGAVQSNHCRQVAAAAARLGLGCILVLAGEDPGMRQGNLFLDELSGARLIFVPKEERDLRLQQAFAHAKEDGMQPYIIPYGGSNPIGVQGYIQAMQELQDQNLQPDWIVLASSSGGTQAGLLLGAEQTRFAGRILGISVDKPADELTQTILALANQTAAWLGMSTEISSQDVLVNDAYCQAGYGVLQPAEVEAIQLFARKEGILLDPVYTGRAAAGLIDLIRKGFFSHDETVLFWHTGGIPALFAEPYASALLR